MFKKLYTHTYAFFSSSVIKNFLIYSSGAFFLRAITVLMMPLYARMLSPEDFGKVSLLHSAIRISIALCGLGLPQALSLDYFHYTHEKRKQAINDILALYFFIMVPLFLVCGYFYPVIAHFFCLGSIPLYLLLIGAVIVFISFFVELFYQVMQYEQVALQVTWLQIGSAGVTAAVTLLLLWFLRYGFASIMYGQLVGLCCSFGVGVYFYAEKKYYQHVAPSPNIKKYTNFLMQGLPFIPAVLSGWLLASGDRWVLARYSSLYNVGIYSVANMFAQLFQFLILYPWGGAYLPYILRKYVENKDSLVSVERLNKRIMAISMCVASVIVTVGVVIGKPIIQWLLPAAYGSITDYIWFLLMGQVFVLGAYFSSSFIQYHKKSLFLSFALCLPAVLNIGLNILLIPDYAIYGCVVATLLSSSIYFIVTFLYSYYLQKGYEE